MMCDFVVVKDGKEIRKYRSLPAAKKLADAEGAEVFCDGARVYPVDDAPERYRLKALMNVREKPDIRSAKLGQLKTGTEVDVLGITDDWLNILWKDGTAFVLYSGGEFAERI